MKMNKIKNKFFLSLILICLLLSCKKNVSKDFFTKLKGANISMQIESNKYFIKSFGISSNPLTVKNVLYWRLHDDNKSYFYLEGYLNNSNDSVMILPISNRLQKDSIKIYKLFDFTLDHKKSWKLYFNIDLNSSKGDSVTFLIKV